jgi:hypothetical protein
MYKEELRKKISGIGIIILNEKDSKIIQEFLFNLSFIFGIIKDTTFQNNLNSIIINDYAFSNRYNFVTCNNVYSLISCTVNCGFLACKFRSYTKMYSDIFIKQFIQKPDNKYQMYERLKKTLERLEK